MTLLPLKQLTEITTGEAWLTAAIGFSLVLIVLAVLALFVKALSAIVSAAANKNKRLAAADGAPDIAGVPEQAQADFQNSADVAMAVTAPGSVVLDGVSEQDAAVIMAITAHRLGKPLNTLEFKSIKLSEE